MPSEIETLVEQSLANTISKPLSNVQGGYSMISYLARSGMSTVPWWSPARDRQLSSFWKQVDYLSGAIYTMESKMSAIPVRVLARDQSIKEHVAEAIKETDRLLIGAEWGKGWSPFYEKFTESLVTFDNGVFVEVIGAGKPDGPVIGRPVTVRILDPQQCLGRDTRVRMADGTNKSILDIVRNKLSDNVLSVDDSGNIVSRPITGWYETKLSGRYWLHISVERPKVIFGRSERIWATNDHEFLTDSGWKRADNLAVSDKLCTESLSPSEKQKEVLYGSLLGDGFVARGSYRASYFSFTQGVDQSEWMDLKKKSMSGLVWSNTRRYKRTLSCETSNTPFFCDVRESWYPGGKRRVNRADIEKYFSPLLLATWFSDDGNRMNGKYGRPKARIYTNSFPEEDVIWLSELLTKHGIKSHVKSLVNTTGKTEYYIYVTCDGAEVLFDMIAPYIPDCLRYKLPDESKPFDDSLWNLPGAVPLYDYVKSIERGGLDHDTAFCIDVADTHNFIAGGVVVHNCQRTGDPEFPVIYHDSKGKLYKLHFTRVMFGAQMESTIESMFGIGFCAVSRAINTAQRLLDILVYNQEKLGSRPRRGIIVTKGGLDPQDVADAFRLVEGIEDSQALSRYSKIAVVGDSSLPDADLDLKDISSLPDGFNERDSVEIGMAVISMALGMDARELFPALQSGATRADALIQHLKQRGKGPGQIIQMTELMFNAKYLPPHLRLVFDFQDDEEDRQAAETKEVRSRRWSTAIKSGSMDTHTARAQMVEVGDLERGQFERLELEDGRLSDGTSVLALFYSTDKQISKLLSIGIDNPLDVDMHPSWEEFDEPVEEAVIKCLTIVVNSSNPDERWSAQKALSALRALRKLYGLEDYLDTKPKLELPQEGEDGTTKIDPRRRKVDLMRPQAPRMGVDELEPETDEERIKEAGGMPSRPF